MSRSRGRKNRQPVYAQRQQTPVPERVEPIRRGEDIELGELGGTDRPPLTASFLHFGERFLVHPDLSELDVIDFFEVAETINAKGNDQVAQQEAMTMIKGFVRRTVAPEDFDRFWASVKKHRQTGQEVVDLMFRVIEGVSGNPTSPPSDSSDGRPVTTPNSPPAATPPVSEKEVLRRRYIAQMERFEAQGTGMGAAMAAQIAVAAQARGVDLNLDPVLSSNGSD